MKLSPSDFEEIEQTVDVARDYLQDSRLVSVAGGTPRADHAAFARNFAEVIVKIAGCCVVGLSCEKHGGAVHGQEAEELRAGVEQILSNTADARDDEAAFVLAEQRKSLIFLLDRIDARDSLVFLQSRDGAEEAPP